MFDAAASPQIASDGLKGRVVIQCLADLQNVSEGGGGASSTAQRSAAR